MSVIRRIANRHWLVIFLAAMLVTLGVLIVLQYLHLQRTGEALVKVSQAPPVEGWKAIERDIPLNVELFRAINGTRHPWLDWLTAGMTFAGDIGVLLPFAAFMVWRFRRWKLRPLLLALFIQFIVVHAIKQLNLPRPITLLDDVHYIRGLVWGSFPSADSATAAVLAAVLYLREPRYLQVLFWLIIPLFAWERVYIGVHFPLDCLVGISIGLLSAFLGYRWDAYFTRRRVEAENASTPTTAG